MWKGHGTEGRGKVQDGLGDGAGESLGGHGVGAGCQVWAVEGLGPPSQAAAGTVG